MKMVQFDDTGTEQSPTLRDLFAVGALENPTICSGFALEYELRHWFGERGGIRKAEIVAAQAYEIADAMLAARSAKR
jgi:hypothetical protein